MRRNEKELMRFGKALIESLRDVIASEERIELEEVEIENVLMFLREHTFTRNELIVSLRIGKANKVEQYNPNHIRAEAIEIILAEIVIDAARLKIAEEYAVPHEGRGLKNEEILKFLKQRERSRKRLSDFAIKPWFAQKYGRTYLFENAIKQLEKRIKYA